MGVILLADERGLRGGILGMGIEQATTQTRRCLNNCFLMSKKNPERSTKLVILYWKNRIRPKYSCIQKHTVYPRVRIWNIAKHKLRRLERKGSGREGESFLSHRNRRRRKIISLPNKRKTKEVKKLWREYERKQIQRPAYEGETVDIVSMSNKIFLEKSKNNIKYAISSVENYWYDKKIDTMKCSSWYGNN